MKVKLRTWDTRFTDPAFAGGVAKPWTEHLDSSQTVTVQGRRLSRYQVPPDPRDGDGRRTVILHGKRVSEESPKTRWPSAELWGVTRCNVLYWHESLEDWDRWFDLHPVEPAAHHKGILAKRPEAWAWYMRQRSGRPIYLLAPHPDVPDAVAFPLAQVHAAFPHGRFTVSVDLLIALALVEGFQRIVLNGIGTRMQPEFQFSHKGILYWIGFAEGRGVEVVIEGPSCYARSEQVYGYDAGAPQWDDPALLEGVPV